MLLELLEVEDDVVGAAEDVVAAAEDVVEEVEGDGEAEEEGTSEEVVLDEETGAAVLVVEVVDAEA